MKMDIAMQTITRRCCALERYQARFLSIQRRELHDQDLAGKHNGGGIGSRHHRHKWLGTTFHIMVSKTRRS